MFAESCGYGTVYGEGGVFGGADDRIGASRPGRHGVRGDGVRERAPGALRGGEEHGEVRFGQELHAGGRGQPALRAREDDEAQGHQHGAEVQAPQGSDHRRQPRLQRREDVLQCEAQRDSCTRGRG